MKILAIVTIAMTMFAPAITVPEVDAAEAGAKVGVLTCNVSSGWGFIVGSSKRVNCVFASAASHQRGERYVGKISKFGADIGYSSAAVMVWAVVAPTSDVKRGALAGDYVGATASAAVGVGAGAHVLVGGSHKAITLQPVSVEGDAGLNIAAGVESLTLTATR